MNKQRIAILITAGIGAIATFLPWVKIKVQGVSASGVGDTAIAFTLILFATVIVLSFLGDITKRIEGKALYGVIIPPIIAALIGAIRISDMYSLIKHSGVKPTLQFGFYLFILAGIAVPLLAYFIKDEVINEMYKAINEKDKPNYETKNKVNFVWFIPVGVYVFYLISLGSYISYLFSYPEVLWHVIVGGLIGAFVLWVNNKDMSIAVTNDKLIVKKTSTDIREYSRTEILSYRISKDAGKTVLRISGSDKSEYEITSYFLGMDGLDKAIHDFISEQPLNTNTARREELERKPKEEAIIEEKPIDLPEEKISQPVFGAEQPVYVNTARDEKPERKRNEEVILEQKSINLPEEKIKNPVNKKLIGLIALISVGIIAIIAFAAFVFVIPAMSESSAWDQAIEVNTVESYNKYLTKYPEGKYLENAKTALEEIQWQNAVKADDINYYNAYIRNYPKGKHSDEAKTAIEEIQWLSATKTDDINLYNTYIQNYPSGKYVYNARSKISELEERASRTPDYPVMEVYNTANDMDPYLNVRELPDANSGLVAKLEDGVQVYILEIDLGSRRQWYKIQVVETGQVGYTSKKWLR